jgi:competence protein ComEA
MKPWQNILLGCLLSLFSIGAIYLVSRPPRGKIIELIPPPTAQPIAVHIDGAIIRPGVYYLPIESRVQDLVQAAGGFATTAETISINLAARLEDGQKVVVPDRGDKTSGQQGFTSAGVVVVSPTNNPSWSSSSLININTATKETLERLPGIGPSRADQIIAYRLLKGPFMRIEDIMEVSGIGTVTYNQIKDLISIK